MSAERHIPMSVAGHVDPDPHVRHGNPLLVEILLLTGTATMILWKYHQGVLSYYIHPRYTWLAVAAAGVLLVVAVARALSLRKSATFSIQIEGWSLLLVIPLVLGFALPARPLSSAALSQSTIGQVAPIGNQQSLGADSRTWNILQWVTAINTRPEVVPGRPVDVVGFVYHDAAKFPGGFYVVRFVITCCVADGSGVGLPVLGDSTTNLADDTWVRVQGTMSTAVVSGQTQPAVLASSVVTVSRPADVYLYAYR